MKLRRPAVLGALVLGAALLGLEGCGPSTTTGTTVHVGVGVRGFYYPPYGYGPGWGYGRPPVVVVPPPPGRPPNRPPPSRPPQVNPLPRPPSQPIGPTPRPPVARPRG